MKQSTFWYTLSRPQAQQAVVWFIMVSLILHSLVIGEKISFMILIAVSCSLASLTLTATLRVSQTNRDQPLWSFGIKLFRFPLYPLCFGLFVFIIGYFFLITPPAFSPLQYLGLPIILALLIFQSYLTREVTTKNKR